MAMRVVIATGGSGGHVFPALTVGRALRTAGHRVVFAGAFQEWQGLVRDSAFDCVEFPAKGFKAGTLTGTLVSAGLMIKSFGMAFRFLKTERPDVILGFGGYGSFPVVLAAAVRGIPSVIHEQNVVPGRANRWLGLLATKVALSFDQGRRFFSKNKAVVTGYPVREFPTGCSREESRKEFGLEPQRWTIAVVGGSQGSRTLNTVMVQAAGLLKGKMDFQILHIAGSSESELVRLGYEGLGLTHRVFSFYQDIHKFYLAADLVVSRAGAGAIHELLYFGLPAVIVPYPYAGAHQKQNAAAFTQTGQGILIEEGKLSAQRLSAELLQLSRAAKPAATGDENNRREAVEKIIRLLEECAAR